MSIFRKNGTLTARLASLVLILSVVLGPIGTARVQAETISVSKVANYVLTLLEHDPVIEEQTLPKITIAYPEGNSEDYLTQADQYSAQFSKNSFLTSVSTEEGLRDRIPNTDVLLLLSSDLDPSQYATLTKKHSVLTIALGTRQVIRNDVSVSIVQDKTGETNIHVNWKRLNKSEHNLSYKILNLAKVHR